MSLERNSASPSWPLGLSVHIQTPHDIEEVRAAGIQRIELTWQSLDIFDAEVFKRCEDYLTQARNLGIEINTLHIPYGDEWDPSSLDPAVRQQVIENAARVFRIAKQWEVPKLVFHPSYEPISDEERPRRLAHAKASLEQLARHAQDIGVQLAVECLPRTCLGNTSDEIAYLLPDHPNAGICFDANHLLQETPEAFIRRLGPRIVTTHISDNDGLDEKHWVPGEGIIDWQEVIQALQDVDYRGVFLYETRMVSPHIVADNYKTILERGGK